MRSILNIKKAVSMNALKSDITEKIFWVHNISQIGACTVKSSCPVFLHFPNRHLCL